MSKEVVKQFNRAITQAISPEELEAFYKVAEVILTKLHNKSIFVTPQIQL
jgi:hypothetical protein